MPREWDKDGDEMGLNKSKWKQHPGHKVDDDLVEFVSLEEAVSALASCPGPVAAGLPLLALLDALPGGEVAGHQPATTQHLGQVAALEVRLVAVDTLQLLLLAGDGQAGVDAPGLAVRVLPLGGRGVLSTHLVQPSMASVTLCQHGYRQQ